MNQIDFITMSGGSDRFDILILNSQNICKFHPDSTYWIYNTGLSESEVKCLSKFDNIEVVDWLSEADYEKNTHFIEQNLAKIQQYFLDNKYTNHLIELSDIILKSAVKRWDFFVTQKPYVIKNFSQNFNSNFIWLDDDAFINNTINTRIFDNFDVGVTIRSKYNEKCWNISPVNAGVIFFSGCGNSLEVFVNSWIERMIEFNPIEYPLREQKSLSELCTPPNVASNEIKYNQTATLKLHDTNVKVSYLPTYLYNHSFPQYGVNPKMNKILHFKGGNYKSKFNKQLISEALQGNLRSYYR